MEGGVGWAVVPYSGFRIKLFWLELCPLLAVDLGELPIHSMPQFPQLKMRSIIASTLLWAELYPPPPKKIHIFDKT